MVAGIGRLVSVQMLSNYNEQGIPKQVPYRQATQSTRLHAVCHEGMQALSCSS